MTGSDNDAGPQNGDAGPQKGERAADQPPVRKLSIISKVIVGVFAAGLFIVAAGVVSGGTRTIIGRPMVATGAAAALNRDTPGTPSVGAGSPKVKPVHELGTNPVLGEGLRLAEVTCQLPALGRSDDELSAFDHAQLKCLNEAWDPVLKQVNEPTLTAKSQVKLSDHSPCGLTPDGRKALAYYCAGDTTIYAPSEWMLRAVGLNKGSHLATIAHEYGHHVQNESGILTAAVEAMTSSDQSSPADGERVRRVELQANCFGALFLASTVGRGAVTASVANAAIADYGNTSDSETHGSRKHQLSWARAGFESRTTAACNTWIAPVLDVS